MALTNKTSKMFREWALEAHKLDSSMPVSYYYNLFVDELRRKYSKETKEAFFRHGIIE